MDRLKTDLDDLNIKINNLESEIQMAEKEAQNNIAPLAEELKQLKHDKRIYASKNDLDSVENCRRRESNLKFRIDAEWNRYSILKNDLTILKKQKHDLEAKIKLEEDKIRRNNEIRSQMDKVLKNYKKSQNLKQAAIDSNIHPGSVSQWYEWGRDNINDTYSYFFNEIAEIDSYFRDLETRKLTEEMDRVIEAYRKTHSLNEAAKIADVNPDTVSYWYEWGSRGFGRENSYFYRKINEA